MRLASLTHQAERSESVIEVLLLLLFLLLIATLPETRQEGFFVGFF